VRPPGGVWSAPEDGPSGPEGALSSYVQVDAAGNAVALGGMAFRAAGGGWSTLPGVPAAGQTASDRGESIRFVVGPDGTTLAAWSDIVFSTSPGSPGHFIGTKGLMVAVRPPGGSWSPRHVISEEGTSANVLLAVDPKGTALVVLPGGTHAVWHPPGGTWSAPEAIPGPGIADVAFDGAGNAFAVWARTVFTGVDPNTGQTSSTVRIEATTRPAGGSWGAPDVLAEAPGAVITPQVALGALGGGVVAWKDQDALSVNERVEAIVREPGGAWSAPATLSAPTVTVSGVQIGVSASGDAVVTWLHDENTGTFDARAYAATYEATGALPKPPAASAPTCKPLPATAGTPKAPGRFELSADQLITNQRIGQAAIRRLNAVDAWLDAGIETRDLCGGAIGGPHLDPGVSATLAPGPVAAPTVPDPRPVVIATATPSGDAVQLSVAQLLVNQRIYQAAIRRAAALEVRLAGKLTGGDLKTGAVRQDKLTPRLLVLSATAATQPAPSRTEVAPATPGRPEAVTLTVKQLRINQRIAQAAVRRANALVARLRAGLTGAQFASGTITARALADDLPGLEAFSRPRPGG
jgi:hypothetical protein